MFYIYTTRRSFVFVARERWIYLPRVYYRAPAVHVVLRGVSHNLKCNFLEKRDGWSDVDEKICRPYTLAPLVVVFISFHHVYLALTFFGEVMEIDMSNHNKKIYICTSNLPRIFLWTRSYRWGSALGWGCLSGNKKKSVLRDWILFE